MKAQCAICESQVERFPSQIKGRMRVYCSKECRNKGRSLFGRRENSGGWRGGRSSNGIYVRIYQPGHPRAHGGYVLEHILVAEKMMGREILRSEVVHHKNHVPTDNRPENLIVLASEKEHWQYKHHKPKLERICWCGNIHCAKGLCTKHYKQSRRITKNHEKIYCLVCGGTYYGGGFCRVHYMHEYFQARKENRKPNWPLVIKPRRLKVAGLTSIRGRA